ncbi:ATP-grasp domain-containing protein [Aerococcaceae bacterium INB8]|uniref:ATP-grasp domain-containing protein n=1 Tax=Ruoffia halotolerans TaxID=2748684 RepID=A0A839A8B2_9LACT|nr:ATP-grasp domain-containing protein [Ruoffia halotolerans]MBA5730202.1 ATP-grasp domain-containing protein [Ruoffia halotolerans]
MNILILSGGTRNKIVQYFKKELGTRGRVLVTDCSPLAPALYEADEYFLVSRITEHGYIDEILNICKGNNITGVLSLIDPELTLLAENYDKFKEIGTTPIISDVDLINLSFDKYEFSKFVTELGFKSIRSYKELESFNKDYELGVIDFPVFAKPITGSASININKVTSNEQLEDLFNRYDDLLIQEMMDEKEYGVDVYIDMVSHEPVSIFIKEKLAMRAGETDKSVSVRNEKLFNIIFNFVKKAGYRGIIDIDVFEKNGEFYISEVNPRFGGGYPHAYEVGVNVPKQIINNLNNNKNKENFEYEQDIFMMKFNEVNIQKIVNNRGVN